MALESDSQGFLIGSPTDLTNAVGVLEEIRDLIRDGGGLSTRQQSVNPSKTSPIPFIPAGASGEPRSPVGDAKGELAGLGKSLNEVSKSVKNGKVASFVVNTNTPVQKQAGAALPKARLTTIEPSPMPRVSGDIKPKAATPRVLPDRDKKGQFVAGTARKSKEKAVIEPAKRDSKGRFSNGPDGSSVPSGGSQGDGESTLIKLASRVISATHAMASGAGDSDPLIGATKEVIEPAQRGWEALDVRIGKGDKDKNRWFRNIWKELNLFRQDATVHDKAQEKALKGIEGSQGGEKSGGSSWMKYLLILPALYLLLTKTKAGEFVGNLVTKGLKNLLGFNDDPNATPEEKAAYQNKLENTTFGAKVGGAFGGVLGFMSPIPGGAALGAGLGAGLGGWLGSKSENPEKTVSNIGWGAGIGAGLGGALGFMSPIPGGAMMGAKLGGVAGGALGAYSEDFDKWVYELMDTIGKSWNETAIPFFKTGWDKAMDGLKSGWDDFTGFAKDKWQAISDAWGTLSQSFTKMLKDKFGIDLPAIGDGIGKVYANVKDAVAENAGMANAWIKQKTGVDVNAAVGNGIDNTKKAVGGGLETARNAIGGGMDKAKKSVGGLVSGAKTPIQKPLTGQAGKSSNPLGILSKAGLSEIHRSGTNREKAVRVRYPAEKEIWGEQAMEPTNCHRRWGLCKST